MGKLQLFIFSVLLLGGLASCKTQEVDPSVATTYASNIKDITDYATSKGMSGTSTSSGLYYVVTKASSSTVIPAYGQELEFTYTLSVLSRSTSNTAVVTSTKVDSAYATNPTFIPFIKGALKAGLEEGLLAMHEGDQVVLLMPSILAYGDVISSDGLVPANSPVRFDVTLNRTRTEDQQMDEYVAATGLSLTQTTTTGLRFFLTTPSATGDSVKTALDNGLTLTVKYVGKQLHAKTAVGFDSTTTSLSKSNLAGLVAGFSEGLVKLKVGDKATFLFPSSIGYSTGGLVDKSTGFYKVAPYAPLRYDVEVISAK
ncbi:FKBP-type peptidylprolyl isomerase [Spirosoma sp. HMF4905]|uniref:Peptidyl-prolyl cis-trans isomerase n=1 Tax=Spirosoma arboris TaxID=2682092 RepID=A0A7K1SAP7_9BACT|nr:FKBP-type peptidyl-prolyl cis-trans isomerase [Spirosoma arboris]MVM30851.1 FKBP-type peptidylprolyl isomerase [Spirosoma arboris]